MRKKVGSLKKLKNQSIPTVFEDKVTPKIAIAGEKHFLSTIELESIMTNLRYTISENFIDSLITFLRQHCVHYSNLN